MPDLMSEALAADLEGDFHEATRNYELEIERDGSCEDAFVNLSFIYWYLAFSPPPTLRAGVSDTWSTRAGDRYADVIEQGMKKYPESLELAFWKRYFSYRSAGDPFSESDCCDLIAKYPKSETFVPYFFLYLFDRSNYEKQASILRQECEQLPTTKNKYIKSILSTNSCREGRSKV